LAGFPTVTTLATPSTLAKAGTGFRHWTDVALSFFYPEACQLCGVERATHRDGFVGQACRKQVQFIRPPLCERCGLPFEGDITTAFECANCREMELHFVYARAAVAVSGPVLEVIHRYKYQRALWFEPFLADLLIGAAAPELSGGGWDCLVPVPLHPRKKNEREFNQAERLARRLSLATGIPSRPRLLRRVTPTRTQTLLTREQRAANVRRAFVFRGGSPFEGQSAILVDDVLTTGATTSACAKALLENGAKKVCVWTVARGLMK